MIRLVDSHLKTDEEQVNRVWEIITGTLQSLIRKM